MIRCAANRNQPWEPWQARARTRKPATTSKSTNACMSGPLSSPPSPRSCFWAEYHTDRRRHDTAGSSFKRQIPNILYSVPGQAPLTTLYIMNTQQMYTYSTRNTYLTRTYSLPTSSLGTSVKRYLAFHIYYCRYPWYTFLPDNTRVWYRCLLAVVYTRDLVLYSDSRVCSTYVSFFAPYT